MALPQLISENILYGLVIGSGKPKARPFQDWVTKVGLPATRENGGSGIAAVMVHSPRASYSSG